ncbi:MAG: amidohydrolase family protein [Bryobacteraceae bacterium]
MTNSAFCLCACLVGISCLSAQAETIVLRGATVHPVSSPELANSSVLIQDGKIADVGPRVSVSRGARVIDVKGLHIYPGLIDSATEIGISEIGAVREMNDVTELGLFKPHLRAAAAVNPSSEHIPVTRANGITSVITTPGGGIIAGQAALLHLNGWTIEEMAVKSPAAIRLEFPHIASGRNPFADTPGRESSYADAKKKYEEQLRELNDFMEAAEAYRHAKTAGSVTRPDLRLEAMMPVLDGRVPLLIRAEKARTIREAIAFSDKYKVRMVLERPAEAWKVATLLKDHNVAVVLPPTLRLPEDEDDPYDKPFSMPSDLSKAGVKFAFATFGPGAGQNPRNLPYEASAAVAFGLPYEEALKAVTLYPAQIWGCADILGSIEKGKLADLIVTDGDPLETRTQIKQVYIKGVPVDLENKHHRLYVKYLGRP